MIAGLLPSFRQNVDLIASLHVTDAGRDWMAKLGQMSLKDYLAFRDGPVAGLD